MGKKLSFPDWYNMGGSKDEDKLAADETYFDDDEEDLDTFEEYPDYF